MSDVGRLPMPSADRWREIAPLLDAALALPPDRRASFVAAACGADDALRAELARMVAECERVERESGVLDRPAAEAFASLHEERDTRQRLDAALRDRYAIEREIGRGGMGIVYLARDLRHGRAVALKVLPSELGAGRAAARFQREIRFAAGLQHPNVVPVFDSGTADGALFYTMPFVAGETLRARLHREGRLTPEDATKLLRELADALAYAHGEGVVHRDLKPENVLLSHGHAVVADFGVAKAVAAAAPDGARTSGTAAGIAVGTLAYMAPEQIAGDLAIDHRADLYALGIIAYELLAGVHPFSGLTPPALLAAHLTEVPAPLADVRPDVPPSLGALVGRLLAKAPEDRPQSAGDVMRALDAVTRADDAFAPRPRVARSPRTKLAAATLVIAAAAGAGTLYARRAAGTHTPAAALVPNRVLVVPFENATGDSTLAPLGRMVAEAVEEGLAATGFVEVASPADAPVPLGDAGARAAAVAARAETVVSGTYFLSGDSIRVQPRVTDVAAARLLRGVDAVAAPRKASTALIDLVRQRVMAVIAATHATQLADFEASGSPPTYAAAEEFVTGADFAGRGDPRRALEHFERAATLDSSYALPILTAADMALILDRVAIADSLVRPLERRRATLTPFDRAFLDKTRGIIDGDHAAELAGARAVVAATPGAPLPHFLLAQAAEAANRPREALAALAHPSLRGGPSPIARQWIAFWRLETDALHVLGDHRQELEQARAGRRLLPESADLLACELRALAALGRPDEVDRQLDQLESMSRGSRAEAQPISTLLISLAEELDAHGHPDVARRTLRRALDWIRGRPSDERTSPAARADLARALYLLGEYDQAAPLVAQMPATPEALAWRGVLAARRRHDGTAAQVDAQLRALRRPYDRGATPYARARIAAQRGQRDAAITLLREALERGVPYGPAVHADPDFAPLRDDPRFGALLRPEG